MSPTMLLFRVSFFIVLLYLSRLSVHVWAKMMSIWYSWGEKNQKKKKKNVSGYTVVSFDARRKTSKLFVCLRWKKKGSFTCWESRVLILLLNDTTQKDYGFLQHISVRHLSFSGSIHHFTCSLARVSSTDLTGHLSLICLTHHCAYSESLQGCRCICLWLLSAPWEQHSVYLDVCLMDPQKNHYL